MVAHLLALLRGVGLFVDLEEHDVVLGEIAEGVPLVLALPFGAEVGVGRVVLDDRTQDRDLLGRVTAEETADHIGEPRPVFFGRTGIRSRMHADERAAVLHPSLEGRATSFGDLGVSGLGFLRSILREDVAHDVARRAHERHHAVLREVLGGEDRGVFSDVGFEALGLELLGEQGVAEWDRILVTEAGGLREDQGAVRFGGEGGHRSEEQGEEGADHGESGVGVGIGVGVGEGKGD